MAEDEEEHRKELAERIVELGGEPIHDWEEILKQANYPKITYPADRSDWQGFLKSVLEPSVEPSKFTRNLLITYMRVMVTL